MVFGALDRVLGPAMALVSSMGSFLLFGASALRRLIGPRFWRLQDVLSAVEEVGSNSLFVVTITSLFTGMVLAVQTIDQFLRFGASEYIGGVIALSMIREMGPVLTAVVVIGRVGSAMAAEVASMKVSEQIDAVEGFGVDPISYIVVPRLLASLVAMPALVLYADAVGMLGGLLFSLARGVSFYIYHRSVELFVEPLDVLGSILKALVFGLLMTVISCERGFRTEGGARGVGRSTTSAVVWSNMAVLAFNYLISLLLFGR